MHNPPGTQKAKRFRVKPHYELIGCGINGHELVGVNARKIRAQDYHLVREIDGLRWYRCLRCDAWLPLQSAQPQTEKYVPTADAIEVPLRGKLLRDRYVLRLIAADRALHVTVLGILALVIFLFAGHNQTLRTDYTTILNAFQGVNGGAQTGELSKLSKLFTLKPQQIYELGFAVLAYAVLEAVEMVGLWFAKRWAEYLTLLATLLFIPYEISEVIDKPTALKIAAFAINVGIAIYLLYAKRLFGLHGGGKAEQRERDLDSGWQVIERNTPAQLVD